MSRTRLVPVAGALVLALGAVAYAVILGPVGLTFDATPLVVGAIALAAAAVGRATHLVASGCALAGWGAAVLVVRHGPLPDTREAAAFLIGAGLGLVAARVMARAGHGRPLADGATALVLGGVAFLPGLRRELAVRLAVLVAGDPRVGRVGVRGGAPARRVSARRCAPARPRSVTLGPRPPPPARPGRRRRREAPGGRRPAGSARQAGAAGPATCQAGSSAHPGRRPGSARRRPIAQ